jgi:Flp pilus assembly pilin Flp
MESRTDSVVDLEDVKKDVKQKDQKGVTTVEYAVMLVLVAIAVLAFGKGIANSVTSVFSTLASALK